MTNVLCFENMHAIAIGLSHGMLGSQQRSKPMFRIRVRVAQHGWTFLAGCFPTRVAADVAVQRHMRTHEAVMTKYQVVVKAWYVGR